MTRFAKRGTCTSKFSTLRIYITWLVFDLIAFIALTFGTRTFLYNHTNKRGVFNLITYSQMKYAS